MPPFRLPTVRSQIVCAAVLATAAALAGCTTGPDYVRPTLDIPAAYREDGPWKLAEPGVIDSNRMWWQVYGDPTLDALIAQANQANQTVQRAEAIYRQTQAALAAAGAAQLPVVGATAGAGRGRTNNNGSRLTDTFSAGLTASWEVDLWGSIRRAIEASQAATQSSSDDLAAARLSIQATLAQNYFLLRVNDRLRDLYARTLAAYKRSAQLAQAQYAAGTALRSDVALAETQLRTAQALAIDLEAQRNLYEHAIAMLMGRAPAQFSLPPVPADAPLPFTLPTIPTGVPSDLLERRPDIASAERLAAAANANIGVARAAYYPRLTLSASGGYAGPVFGDLLTTPTRVWSLGAALAQTLFDGGLRKARDAQAVAAFDAAAAQYRQVTLAGFQEVEDNLSTLRVLDREIAVQDQAVRAAQLAEQLALTQYRAGTATYLSVVTAQTLLLTNQRTAAQLLARQLVASVTLIRATGGGWSTADTAPLAVSSTDFPSLAR